MNLEKNHIKNTDFLKSGDFYFINFFYKVYRINEPDTFLKNSNKNLFVFFDNKKYFNHFNSFESKFAAKTHLEEIFLIEGLTKISFLKLTDEGQDFIKNFIIKKKIEYNYENIDFKLIKKTYNFFRDQKNENKELNLRIDEILKNHKKEYLLPPDLTS